VSEEKEAFFDRWSRLKREQPAEPPAVPQAKKAEETVPPPLPPVADLKPESDFTPFMNVQVDPATRRSALKKLFADAHYNIPDAFEAYSEDYTKSDPIPEKMLKAINRVRDLAVDGPEKVAEKERLAEQAEQAEQAELAEKVEKVDVPKREAEDAPGKQDA
jgi:hypothetical protein